MSYGKLLPQSDNGARRNVRKYVIIGLLVLVLVALRVNHIMNTMQTQKDAADSLVVDSATIEVANDADTTLVKPEAPRPAEAPKPAVVPKLAEPPKPAEAPRPAPAPAPIEPPKPVEAPKPAEAPKAPEPAALLEPKRENLNQRDFFVSVSQERCSSLNRELRDAWKPRLPKRLLVTLAAGYNYDRIRFLVNSFLYAKQGMPQNNSLGLVLFVERIPDDWRVFDENIFFFTYKINQDEVELQGRPPVLTRFAMYKCMMHVFEMDASTRIFTLDARDTIIQKNPFVYPEDGRLRFYYESGIINDVFINQVWLASCSSDDFSKAFSGTLVVNDGTIYGQADELLKYYTWFVQTIFAKRTCNDQGLHIYAVTSGAIRGIVNFRMETNEWGRVLSAHAANKLLYLNQDNLVCSKITEEPYVIAHQYDRIDHIRKPMEDKWREPPTGTRFVPPPPPPPPPPPMPARAPGA